jgi:hypothetical protein
MLDVGLRMRFAEEIRRLIEQNTAPEYPAVIVDAALIYRTQVEEIGRSLGITESDACRRFWRLQGKLWDVHTGSTSQSLIKASYCSDNSDEARNWQAIKDVILLAS